MFDESDFAQRNKWQVSIETIEQYPHKAKFSPERCLLHREDECCAARMGDAQGGWVLHREEGGLVLHRQDGCCMGRMNAAQGGC